MSAPLDVIAMHGWAGDARCWDPWRAATGALGWSWQCGERGYGMLEARQAAWDESGSRNSRRMFIGHSL